MLCLDGGHVWCSRLMWLDGYCAQCCCCRRHSVVCSQTDRCLGRQPLVLCLDGGHEWCSRLMAGRPLCSLRLLSPLRRPQPDWSLFVVATVAAVFRRWPRVVQSADVAGRPLCSVLLLSPLRRVRPDWSVSLVAAVGAVSRRQLRVVQSADDWTATVLSAAVGATPSSAARLLAVCVGGGWCCVSMVATCGAVG